MNQRQLHLVLADPVSCPPQSLLRIRRWSFNDPLKTLSPNVSHLCSKTCSGSPITLSKSQRLWVAYSPCMTCPHFTLRPHLLLFTLLQPVLFPIHTRHVPASVFVPAAHSSRVSFLKTNVEAPSPLKICAQALTPLIRFLLPYFSAQHLSPSDILYTRLFAYGHSSPLECRT